MSIILILIFVLRQVLCQHAEPSPSDPVLNRPAFANNVPNGPADKASVESGAFLSVRTTSSSSVGPTVSCDARIQSCPSCNGQIIKDPIGRSFKTLCQTEARSSNNTQLILGSPAACIDACRGTCLAATYIWEGICTLAMGSNITFQDRTGGYGVSTYLLVNGSVAATLPANATSGIKYSSSHSARPSPLVPTSSRSKLSFNPGGPIIPAPTPSMCSSQQLTCPKCDYSDIVDSHKHRYRVLCESQLLSTASFGYAEPHSIDTCLAQCDDRGVDCIGIGFEDGNCVLALGRLYGKVPNASRISFLSFKNETATLLPVTTAPPISIAHPTGKSTMWTDDPPFEGKRSSLSHAAVPLLNSTSKTHRWPSTSIIAHLPPSKPSGCAWNQSKCPECDDAIVSDDRGHSYQINCGSGQNCWKTNAVTKVQTFNDCLALCNQDPLCAGGFYENWSMQTCSLCELGSFGHYASSGTVAFSRQFLPWRPIPQMVPTLSKSAMSASMSTLPSPETSAGKGILPFFPWPFFGPHQVDAHGNGEREH